MWNAEEFVEELQLQGHSGAVCGCAFIAECQRIVSASVDRNCKVWDICDASDALPTVPVHRAPMKMVTPNSTRKHLQMSFLFNDNATTKASGYHTEPITASCVRGDGSYAVTGSQDGEVKASTRAWHCLLCSSFVCDNRCGMCHVAACTV